MVFGGAEKYGGLVMKPSDFEAKIWEEDLEIPTYPVGKPDKNPMFLEKRVYQGSSGKVYPYPVIDKIYDRKVTQKYRAVFLENPYLLIAILPELGGRIQRALDKTNNYDFVYYNRVIKPALVGLTGPWISGGIEFNWPQHHRPNTFGPVEHLLKENPDGSKTVWVSEIDRMYGTKVTTGFTLYPDKAYLEIKSQLYNRTPEAQTFLWWANPAVAVNNHTQSVFPPDVHAVFDHGKRDVSRFPIATGTYYKMDYSAGVDISRYKNIPVPTSYMAYHSDYNFVGGYDHAKHAGILHIADHHISPGKKQWTWGCGDFGQAWDRNLTDEEGPYIELMTGVYTDNQPDFSWLLPNEEKSFTQYFLPYKNIGVVKNASIEAAVNLEIEAGKAIVAVYATSVLEGAVIELKSPSKNYLRTQVNLAPENSWNTEIALDPDEKEYHLRLTVFGPGGKMLVTYQPAEPRVERIPDPAKPALSPSEIRTTEALYLTAVHLEQYRHATFDPEPYYLEGLKRDPEDIRLNNGYGALLFRRGRFEKSETYFRRAIAGLTRYNPNPYDTEPYYNLGLALKFQGRLDEAYDAFYKSVWSAAWQDSGYFSLTQIACWKTEYSVAQELVGKSLVRNYHNYKARHLQTVILRKLGRYAEAENLARETIQLDPLDFGSRRELQLCFEAQSLNEKAAAMKQEVLNLLDTNEHNFLELARDYGSAGFFAEAGSVLQDAITLKEQSNEISPLIYYYLGYYADQKGDPEQALFYFQRAMAANSDYCFPNRLEDILVLRQALKLRSNDAKAYYYLGNLWYDKKQFDLAIECWEKSRAIDDSLATVHRNLALGYYNKQHDPVKAGTALEKAFSLNQGDARVFLELDQFYKKTGIRPELRLEMLEKHQKLVQFRDDLFVEYVTLHNQMGNYERAKQLIAGRKFHPWEGGEGKISAQYVYAHVELAKEYLQRGDYQKAIAELEQTDEYPENLGEGKLYGSQENHIHYFLGCAYEGLGLAEQAREFFVKASVGLSEPTNAMFYNDQPADMIFYQGLALLKLNQFDQAKGRFNKLVAYGEKHLFDEVSIDYFAVSLPDFLIFDEDLTQKNEIHCRYLLGLGYLGLNELQQSRQELMRVLEMDPNHLGALTHQKIIFDQEIIP
jgi:Tfp pilus assembly protein PilF